MGGGGNCSVSTEHVFVQIHQVMHSRSVHFILCSFILKTELEVNDIHAGVFKGEVY